MLKRHVNKAEIWFDPPGFKKMSQLIIDLAQPWVADAQGEEDVRAILEMAICAWNLSLL